MIRTLGFCGEAVEEVVIVGGDAAGACSRSFERPFDALDIARL